VAVAAILKRRFVEYQRASVAKGMPMIQRNLAFLVDYLERSKKIIIR